MIKNKVIYKAYFRNTFNSVYDLAREVGSPVFKVIQELNKKGCLNDITKKPFDRRGNIVNRIDIENFCKDRELLAVFMQG